jgi:hypothetical protein
MDFLKSLDAAFLVLLGWALGLFSPKIHEYIRRTYRQRELMNAVVDEFLGLQYTLAFVAYQVRSRQAAMTDKFLDFIMPVFEHYQGPDPRKMPEAQRAALYKSKMSPKIGMNLVKYSPPLLATQISDLTMCPLDFQRSVLRVHHHLDLFNQSVPYTHALFQKTFDKPTELDRGIIIQNLEQAYLAIGSVPIGILSIGTTDNPWSNKEEEEKLVDADHVRGTARRGSANHQPEQEIKEESGPRNRPSQLPTAV